MPTGTPYSSVIYPYRIRVDDFASNVQPPPLLHLLTHTHSDHVNGLAAKSFGHNVYCSADSKEILLRHEVYAEREYRQLNLRAEKVRTFSHLKVDPLVGSDGTRSYLGSRDLLKPLPLNTPTEVELDASEKVTITLIDANHCPGAVMFLIEGSRGAVLHTGDFRAEPWFLDSLRRNPFLQPYIHHESALSSTNPVTKTLEAIYLDTACVLSNAEIPTKESATAGLVTLMRRFPSDVYFFLNVWTMGYEDILKAISAGFQAKIHVDRYKHSLYHHISDPWLRSITTQDPSATRFHACERFSRCQHVAVENPPGTYANATSILGNRVVYVNPVSMDIETWNRYLEDTHRQINEGHAVNNLLVPLARHSTLPELQRFVSVFRPKQIIPNTLEPRLHGLDWTCIDRMFASCLHPTASRLHGDSHTSHSDIGQLAEEQDDGDVSLKNLVGEGAEAVAAKWADGGKLLKKLDILRVWLGSEENDSIERLLGIRSSSPDIEEITPNMVNGAARVDKTTASRTNPAADDDTDHSDLEDERGRTAHHLFASQAGIDEKENTWLPPSSSPASHDADDAGGVRPAEVPSATSQPQPTRLTHGPFSEDIMWRINRLTPATTPATHSNAVKQGAARPISPLAGKSTKRVLSLSKGNGASLASPINLCSSPAPENAGSQNFLDRLLNASPSHQANPSSKHVGRSPRPRQPQSKSQSFSSITTLPKPTPHVPPLAYATAPPSSKGKRKRAEPVNHSPKRKKADPKRSLSSIAATSSASQPTRHRNVPSDKKRALHLSRLAASDHLAKVMGGDASIRWEEARGRLVTKVEPPLQHAIPRQEASQASRASQDPPVLGPTATLILPFEAEESHQPEAVDWNRSRELATRLKAEISMGMPLSLPSLACMQNVQDSDSQ
ncbi:beta-lactamase-like protein [Coprinopsis sp. MPI-PUGE-AT-0042]|nr:beta-lactamase-like protein [Coprinopsis sp. MPI-PUGE-AT-0042]